MVHRDNSQGLLDFGGRVNTEEDEDLYFLAGTFDRSPADTSIRRNDGAGLGIDASRDSSCSHDMPLAEGQQVSGSAWRVEYLADAIADLLDWQDYMLTCKRERKVRAMRTRQLNKQRNKEPKPSSDRVVAVSQRERFRRFLSNGGQSE